MSTVKILNVSIDNLSMEELLKQLGVYGGVVFTPNVDHLMKLQKDAEFYQVYQTCNYRVCDSQILYYASRLLGQPICEKISGSDLFPAFYQYYQRCPNTKIFLLGAAEGIASRAKDRINQIVGREMVVDCYSPPFGFENDEAECQSILDRINQSGATVLAVGLGAPKQEKWIAKYRHQLDQIKIFLAIGATIDFEAGEKPRSPQWVSVSGMEWLYRLVTEPKRLWKRYLIEDLPFVWLLIQQKLNLYKAPFTPDKALTAATVKTPLLGQILLEAGLITASQISLVLDAQANGQQMRFGEILADWGWLSQDTVNFFAEQLPQLAHQTQKQPIGYYLKAAKLLNDEQVNTILAEQNHLQLRFGEIAVRHGWVKQKTVDSVLRSLQSEFNSAVAA
ncbi:MAG: WecB/TagA/CpsF family glycosyltransferase [Microcoleaceae cyanobacterium]